MSKKYNGYTYGRPLHWNARIRAVRYAIEETSRPFYHNLTRKRREPATLIGRLKWQLQRNYVPF